MFFTISCLACGTWDLPRRTHFVGSCGDLLLNGFSIPGILSLKVLNLLVTTSGDSQALKIRLHNPFPSFWYIFTQSCLADSTLKLLLHKKFCRFVDLISLKLSAHIPKPSSCLIILSLDWFKGQLAGNHGLTTSVPIPWFWDQNSSFPFISTMASHTAMGQNPCCSQQWLVVAGCGWSIHHSDVSP